MPARQLGVTTEYLAPETFDMPAMVQLLDAAIASKPDGLVVSIPDTDALERSGQERGRGRHPRDRHRLRRFGAVALSGRAPLYGPDRV